MELSRNFGFKEAEDRWYSHWLEKKYFESRPDQREPYTVVIPPPNVTGILHMGHCLNNTIQDVLVRRARMMGRNACWVPGTDHASIATEAKVVQMLRERGIQKASLSREAFLQYAWEWKEKYGGIILQQLKKLGCSLDWNRTHFTMDSDYYESVIRVFNTLYSKGYIYRGRRMINWDPRALTALSDEEVIFREHRSKLYHVRYQLEGGQGNEYITIATVRPETILGDTAIAVHPDDERYRHLHGTYAIVPLVNRRVPIIADTYVEPEFGTGALKITPAHDPNDFLLAEKHSLEIIDILNDDGSLSEQAGFFIGKDRFEARKLMVLDLENLGLLDKVEDYTHQVGFSERTDAVVEPRLSLQWWVDMKKISGPALAAVESEEIRFHPAKFRNMYRYWMENIRDWCISRQLWWGHRIPAWYDAEGRFVVAMNAEEAQTKYREQYGIAEPVLRQDADVLDTWFSSWLWPFEVFGGISRPGNAELKYYYPTQSLVTAPEIIFFWVARMIMAGYEFMGQKPFSDVYFTGIVRDSKGRKMSKQLGNSPDLLQMIDDLGADAVRFGILISSPAGNDLLWDPATNEQGRNFINKIWNALKLVDGWKQRAGAQKSESRQQADEDNWPDRWFEARLREASREFDQLMAQFKLSEALKLVYSLIWDDFCSWYLEWVKPGWEEPVSEKQVESAVKFFEDLMQLLHPFMPFVTEEVYHQLRERAPGDDLCIRQAGMVLPMLEVSDTKLLAQGEWLKEAITALRDARNKAKLKPREQIALYCQLADESIFQQMSGILGRQVFASSMEIVKDEVKEAWHVVSGKDRFYMSGTTSVDDAVQRETLEKELEYLRGFLDSVNLKLTNEKFVSKARPEVVMMEKKKKEDAETKIRVLEESIQRLG